MSSPKLFDRVRHKLGIKPRADMLAKTYPQYRIGRGSYGPLRIVDYGEGTSFSMGAYCSVAEGAVVHLGGGHRTEWVTTYPFSVLEESLSHIRGHPVSRGDVAIGSDVWLAADCTILSGVTIGHGAVVMNSAVVSRDVAPYSIVGGVPAKEVGTRFDEETIARLLAIAWWDWPHERILAAGPYMLSDNIGTFLNKAEAGEI